MDEKQIDNLRKNAKAWIIDYPAIRTIYLVHASKPKEECPHYGCSLVAIVPEPGDAQWVWRGHEQLEWVGNGQWEWLGDGYWEWTGDGYREWAGDGFSCIHVQDDMARLGFKDFQWLTFRNLESAQQYYDDIIRPELYSETEIEWLNLTDEIIDYETIINSLQVSHVSDTEIKIRGGGKNAKTYGMKELGFTKENSKPWKAFIKILTSRDHFYHVGTARGSNGEIKESYGVAQKVLVAINSKFVPFLNKTYQLQLPENFKIYELIPEKKEAPGTYRFKFQIKSNSDDIECFKAMPKDQLLSKIEKLSEQYRKLSKRGGEEAEKQINKIMDQLVSAIQIASENEWISRNKAEYYLNPKVDQTPPYDLSEEEPEDSNQEE